MFLRGFAHQNTRVHSKRAFSTHALKQRLRELVPERQEQLKKIKKENANFVLGEITIDQVIGGMRGMTGLLYETSKLDAQDGINYRGHSLDDIMKNCPTAVKGGVPTPEAILWLLLTGEYPTAKELSDLTRELKERSFVPVETEDMIRKLPRVMHPMTQFSMGVLSMQPLSNFAYRYRQGMPKQDYWEVVFEDAINVIAKVSRVAALIYNSVYKFSGQVPDSDLTLDYGGNFAHMLGFEDESIAELMRLYLVLHADHEGGNVSAHSCRLVASALSDPYQAFAAGMTGLAGPLHGLANQECLRWLLDFKEVHGENWTDKNIVDFVWHTLGQGKVVPGYGHAVLRNTDPRFTHQLAFANKYFPDDNLVRLVNRCFEIVPQELLKTGKVKNPYPNVDCASGTLLMHYGIDQFDFYTVLFGVARAFGTMSALVWDRALGLPIERPNSVTIDWLQNKVGKS